MHLALLSVVLPVSTQQRNITVEAAWGLDVMRLFVRTSYLMAVCFINSTGMIRSSQGTFPLPVDGCSVRLPIWMLIRDPINLPRRSKATLGSRSHNTPTYLGRCFTRLANRHEIVASVGVVGSDQEEAVGLSAVGPQECLRARRLLGHGCVEHVIIEQWTRVVLE